MEFVSPRISFRLSRYIFSNDTYDLEGSVPAIYGRIMVQRPEAEDEEPEILAGKLKAYLVRREVAREHRIALYDALDIRSQTAPYLELFDDDTAEWSDTVQKLFHHVYPSDLLILDRMQIKKEFRGQGLGLLAARTTMECFGGGCGIVALKPFPLQYESKRQRGRKVPLCIADPEGYKTSLKKLQRYWSRLGMKRVKGTDLWALSLDMRQPTLEKMLKGLSVSEEVFR